MPDCVDGVDIGLLPPCAQSSPGVDTDDLYAIRYVFLDVDPSTPELSVRIASHDPDPYGFRMALSGVPGSFHVPAPCQTHGEAGSIYASNVPGDGGPFDNTCVIAPGATYYVNVRVVGDCTSGRSLSDGRRLSEGLCLPTVFASGVDYAALGL